MSTRQHLTGPICKGLKHDPLAIKNMATPVHSLDSDPLLINCAGRSWTERTKSELPTARLEVQLSSRFEPSRPSVVYQ